MAEASYPFYVLHATVLVAIAFFILQLLVAPVLMYLLIVTITYGGVFGIYEALVRRDKVGRFLFGMKAAIKIDPIPKRD